MALEPFTSIPGTGLQNAITAGTAPVIVAGATVEVELAAWFINGHDPIESLKYETHHLAKKTTFGVER